MGVWVCADICVCSHCIGCLSQERKTNYVLSSGSISAIANNVLVIYKTCPHKS